MPTTSVQGKPTIIFSANADDEAWRFKEKIVAVIGSLLQKRDDLYTFSSRSVRNIANDLENLDVAYASIDDPTDFFSFIEVRDRKSKVGRQYIEEIMGKRQSLEIDTCEIVSTKEFTRDAKRLASKVGISLRVLAPDTSFDSRKWYGPDHIGFGSRVANVEKCSIIAKMADGFQEFQADRSKSSENNILVPTETPSMYRVVSLSQVFDVEVMRDEAHSDTIFEKVPADNALHKATVAYEYGEQDHPYFMHVRDHGILSIAAIVFFVYAGNVSIEAPIEYRFKYIDAVRGKIMAEWCAQS